MTQEAHSTRAFTESGPGRQGRADIPITRIDGSRRSDSFKLDALWGHRELLYFLVWREFKVRYKQTSIGVAWAIFQPLMLMMVFTFVFSHLARLPSDGLPYPIFAYTGLLPWLYFSQAVTRGSNSLVGDANLLQKVYFPRLLIPLSAVLAPLVDFFCSFLILLGMMVWYDITPAWGLLFVPVFLLVTVLTAFSVSLWLSPLNVRYRDVIIVVPVLIQVWMYASPIIYPISLVPEGWRFIYSMNPMAGVIAGFRWALAGQTTPDILAIGVSLISVGFLFWGGLAFFRRMEPNFADFV